jgi:hypothetical protein
LRRSLRMAQRCDQRQYPSTKNHEPDQDPDPHERTSTVSR